MKCYFRKQKVKGGGAMSMSPRMLNLFSTQRYVSGQFDG